MTFNFNLNSITYYQDDELAIIFSKNPHVDFRYPCPGDTDKQIADKLAKPFINMEEVDVRILYKINGQTFTYDFNVPAYYTWDGATIPRFCWRLIGAKTSPEFMIASMIHDRLCENHNFVDNNRYLSTLVLNGLCKTGGVVAWRRFLVKHSVDNAQKIIGGWNAR